MAHAKLQDAFERADACAYRAGIYNLASEAFTTEPSIESLEQLTELGAQADTESAALACEAELLDYLGKLDATDREALRRRIATEYAELFIGPRKPLAPYHESMYVGYPKRTFTEVTRKVRAYYERFGYTVSDGRNRIPDDHIGYELKFMSMMANDEAKAIGEGNVAEADRLAQAQLSFLVVHLASWTRPFMEAVDDAYCADYYAAWAHFAHAFVSADEEYLMSVCKEPVAS